MSVWLKPVAAAELIAGSYFAICNPAIAENGVSADAIVFGQAAALNGPASALGQGMKAGIEAAFAEINKKGGVSGRKLKLISRDDGYGPDKSIAATKSLIEQDKVFAIIGPVSTPTSAATQPIATATAVPFYRRVHGCGLPSRSEVLQRHQRSRQLQRRDRSVGSPSD